MKRLIIIVTAIVSITIAGCSDAGKADDIDASVESCPYEQPSDPTLSCSGDLTCGYGLECCCGACSTATTCNCINGMYACTDTGVCDNPRCEDGGVDGGGVDGG
jgi:hypothetical protein